MNAIAKKADIAAALGETAELLGTDKDGSAFVLLRLKPRVLDALLAMPGLVEDLEDDDPAEDCEPLEDADGSYLFRNMARPLVVQPAIAECRLQDLRLRA